MGVFLWQMSWRLQDWLSANKNELKRAERSLRSFILVKMLYERIRTFVLIGNGYIVVFAGENGVDCKISI